ncbi:hypothetical protein SAMN04487962_1453 [Marinobacter segnicrescens]|uniref:Uncharacterized protein n=1 Tax=Marinobacter segnicrescens TaxID=430453 RepID=A0A1I0I5I2_9GAMM|nr:hypothetical protein SAMN04487962_1453 [Marinobacter segnicrescens]
MFVAGYLFKETHNDVHYVRTEHGGTGDGYRMNFTTEPTEARGFPNHNDAIECVMQLMADFEWDPDYRWTPVTVDMTSGKMVKIMDARWHN